MILPNNAAVLSLSTTPSKPFNVNLFVLYDGIPPPPPAITIVPKSTKCLIDFPLKIYNGLGDGTTLLQIFFSC